MINMPYELLRTQIEAFLDGTTTPAEEACIYSAYSSLEPGSLPSDLERYRAMFAWYASLSGEENTVTPAKPKRRYRAWLKYGAAAVATAAITVSALFISDPLEKRMDNTLYAQYVGSYVIRNGKRISDLDAIMVSVIRAEHIADSLSNFTTELENIPEIESDNTIIENALSGVIDPVLARQLCNDLLNEHSN